MMKLLVLALTLFQATVRGEDLESAKNPIRKVVTMLQAMQKKVEKEGEKEKDLYEKFMCYCKTGGGDLTASISTAETKVPAVQSDIEASEGKLAQTKEDLKKAQADRVSAKDAMAEATAIREKESAAFSAEKQEYDANIGAMRKAINALERGMSGGFLQTDAAQILRRLAQSKQDMVDMDRQELLSFLAGTSQGAYSPASGEITGILKEMAESMEKSLAEATASEDVSKKSYEEMMAAKTKEIQALSASIESKTTSIGELGVAIVQMKEDLTDTEAALIADQQFLKELTSSCETKTKEWEERSKTRADELVALAETIKILNDDDALDLFKKTLASASAASASFVQVTSGVGAARARALGVLKTARDKAERNDRAQLDLLLLTLAGKKAMSKGGFDKVIKMVDNMVATLKKEQDDDDNKREYCNIQFDSSDDKRKDLERRIEDHENAIAAAKEAMSTLTEEIAALEKGIKDLDKSVMEATEQRKAENVEYKELMASNAAAKDLLNFAKNRLAKFYNPKMFKAPPKRELTEEERIFVNNGGELEPTEAPGGIAGTGVSVGGAALAQISAHRQSQLRRDVPAPPPETWGAYSKKSEESSGVIAMVDLLIRDLEKEMTEAETEEKNSQGDYERTMSESASKRAADTKLLAEKGSAKADAETELQSRKEGQDSAAKEHMAVLKYIQSLHSECDWLVQYYDVRKEARAGEVDSLQKAKAVLSGADFAFLQQLKASGFLQRKA